MGLHRDFKGVWIPKSVWLSKVLTLQEKILYVEIDSLDNGIGCFAGNKHFAEFLGLSKKRVSVIINNLVKKGYVSSRIEYIYNSQEISKRYLKIIKHPILPIPKKEKGIPKKEIGIIESREYSNTFSNTFSNTEDGKQTNNHLQANGSTHGSSKPAVSIINPLELISLLEELELKFTQIGLSNSEEELSTRTKRLSKRLQHNDTEYICSAIDNYCFLISERNYRYDMKYSLAQLLTIDRLRHFAEIEIDDYLWKDIQYPS